jgi:hypothetical protein
VDDLVLQYRKAGTLTLVVEVVEMESMMDQQVVLAVQES